MKQTILFLTLVILGWSLSLISPVRADESDLVWSTFLGGILPDRGEGIALDDAGNAYVAGATSSTEFPTTSGAYDTIGPIDWDEDVFVTKLNPAGSALVYSTFLGGEYPDAGLAIAIDGLGCAFVTGRTNSNDFPATPTAYDTSLSDSDDAFVTKLTADGSDLIYSTYLGDMWSDIGQGIAVDDSGCAYVTGYTNSSDFPTTPGAFDTTADGGWSEGDAFVTKFTPAGDNLVYSTFLAGEEWMDEAASAIAVDDSGCAYITGYTGSSTFPVTPGAFDPIPSGLDGFVTKLNPDGSDLIYSTFLGGNYDYDDGRGIALDDAGQAYITGYTYSLDFPTTPGCFDDTYGGDSDGFVTCLNSDGSDLVYSSFLGGAYDDAGQGIAVDSSGSACVTGHTVSYDFPTTPDAYDITLCDDVDLWWDAFMTKVAPAGDDLDYSTYLGGWFEESGRAIAVDDDANIYVTGYTGSDDFPTTAGAFDTTFDSEESTSDVFVAKFSLGTIPPPTPPAAPENLTITLAGDDLFFEWDTVTVDTTGSPILVDSYYVYREIDSDHFGPGSDPFDGGVPASYVDTTGAVGDTAIHYYYAVTAVSEGTESAFSRIVGEFDRMIGTPNMFYLISWPLLVHDTDIQEVLADSLGTGCQITGGPTPSTSDLVMYYDAGTEKYQWAWRGMGAQCADTAWHGSLTEIESDKAYWIYIRGEHPGDTLTMTGVVNREGRAIPIEPGTSANFVGSAFSVPCSLRGPSGDDAGLLASGFTGAPVVGFSDQIYHFDDSWAGFELAWYKSMPGPSWQGRLHSSQQYGKPCFRPGDGYIIVLDSTHAFTDDLWSYPVPPSKSKGNTAGASIAAQPGSAPMSVSCPKDLGSSAIPTFCWCYGGMDSVGSCWPLLDCFGDPLEDGDYAYVAWVGPDGQIDPANNTGDIGATTDDDLILVEWSIECGMFMMTPTIYSPGYGRPTAGDTIYCRIFDGPKSGLSRANYYGNSQIYVCRNEMGENFFAPFVIIPPCTGHTSFPLDDTAPDAIDDLTAQTSGGGAKADGDIRLLWTQPNDDVGVLYYIIYRGTTPGLLGDSLTSTIDTTYLDTGAAGDTTMSYFYVVKSEDRAVNRSDESNQAGEFDKALQNGEE